MMTVVCAVACGFDWEDESIKPVTSMEPRRMMDGVKSITKYIIKKTSDIFSASTGIPCTNMQYIRIFRKSVFCLFSLLLVPIKWRCTHPRLIVCKFGTHHTTHRATLPWHVAVKLNSEQQIWKKKMVWDKRVFSCDNRIHNFIFGHLVCGIEKLPAEGRPKMQTRIYRSVASPHIVRVYIANAMRW